MKRKLFLAFVLVIAFALTFAIVALADTVHNETTVDYSATVTLSDGTVLPLYDESNEALIWYISGTEGGKNVYSSVRTDSQEAGWYTESWDEVTGLSLVLNDGSENGTKIDNGNIVVVNMMDDDVVKNAGPGTSHYGKPVTGFKYLFQGWKKLEYVYLRLDTTNIQKQAFNGCSGLRFINLESLTKLVRIGDNNNFANCTELFKGQVLDLSNTALTSIDWGSSFYNVPIVGIKLPSTIKTLSGGSFEGTALTTMLFPVNMATMEGSMYKNCLSLKSIYLTGKLTTIKDNAFVGCTALEKIFYAGTLEELNTTIAGLSATGNDPFLNVVNTKKISYEEYQKLDDKSGKYVVYNYTSCMYGEDAEGHEEPILVNACVGNCSNCGAIVINHKEKTNITITIAYENYSQIGTKTTVCHNDGCGYDEDEETPAIFNCLGYSVGPNGYSLKSGFTVNDEALNEYKALYPDFSFGVVMANANTVASNEAFFVSSVLNSSAKGLMISIENLKYVSWSIDVSGFNESIADSLELVIGIYAKDAEGNIKVCQFVNTDKYTTTKTYSDMSLNAITFNQVRVGHGMDALVPQPAPASTGDEE